VLRDAASRSGRLYLIRHAKTAPVGPDARLWPLSLEGEAQARELALAPFWSGISALYSSPEGKATSTVRPAGTVHGLTLELDGRLREVQRPARWIEDYEEAVRRYLERPEEPPWGWENADEAKARVSGCIGELISRHPNDRIAVCGHGLSLTLYLAGLDGVSEGAFELWRSVGFAEVAIVEEGALVLPFGYASHAG
jgi:probable phosphoglycerate mutase